MIILQEKISQKNGKTIFVGKGTLHNFYPKLNKIAHNRLKNLNNILPKRCMIQHLMQFLHEVDLDLLL